MIKSITKTSTKRYYVITDSDDEVKDFNLLEEGFSLNTGQSNLFSFLTEEEMVLKLNELTGSDEYYLNSDYYKEKEPIS